MILGYRKKMNWIEDSPLYILTPRQPKKPYYLYGSPQWRAMLLRLWLEKNKSKEAASSTENALQKWTFFIHHLVSAYINSTRSRERKNLNYIFHTTFNTPQMHFNIKPKSLKAHVFDLWDVVSISNVACIIHQRLKTLSVMCRFNSPNEASLHWEGVCLINLVKVESSYFKAGDLRWDYNNRFQG